MKRYALLCALLCTGCSNLNPAAPAPTPVPVQLTVAVVSNDAAIQLPFLVEVAHVQPYVPFAAELVPQGGTTSFTVQTQEQLRIMVKCGDRLAVRIVTLTQDERIEMRPTVAEYEATR